MGHKINPKGFRLGPVYTWDSRWFAKGSRYQDLVLEDYKLRKLIFEKLDRAGLIKVEIERSINKINIKLHVVRPGMVIGRGGQGMEELKKYIQKTIKDHRKKKGLMDEKNSVKLEIKVEPVKEPNLSAYFIAKQISDQLIRRLPHKRVIRFAKQKVMSSGAKGIKITLSGRIAGAEISRRETYKEGKVPLSTIREEIDYASVPSLTKSGYVGVKVWICK